MVTLLVMKSECGGVAIVIADETSSDGIRAAVAEARESGIHSIYVPPGVVILGRDETIEVESGSIVFDHVDFKRSSRTSTFAHAWWNEARKRWGKLQQVRKGTRVRCPFCAGARRGCPMCLDGFWNRDWAIAHYEEEMEMACK